MIKDINLPPLLKSYEIFAELSDQELNTIIQSMEMIELDSGKDLFLQGSTSDALYVLIQGRLVALFQPLLGPEKIIGEIHPGETIGELGLLSNQPRALTIRAARKSAVLKLSKESFEREIKTRPDLLLKIVHIIIARSQQTIRLFNQASTHDVIGLIPANNETSLTRFLQLISNNLQQNSRVKFITQTEIKKTIKSDSHLSEVMDQAEQKYEHLIIEIDPQDINKMSKILEHCDRLLIISQGNHAPLFTPVIKDILIESDEYKHLNKELVLLYPNKHEKPKNTKDWLGQRPFKKHYHVNLDNQKDVQRLLRFLLDQAVGLVLSGGGVKGWAEVGVIKAAYETNIEIDAVGGTSIGSLVGACYMMADNFEDFFAIFNKVLSTENKPFALHNLTFPIISILSGKDGTKALQEIFATQLIENLIKPYFCISCNLSRGIEKIHNEGPLWKAVRSSLSVPGLLPPVTEEGELYVDGGIINNLPVDVMKSLIGNKGTIIAVDLSKEIEIKDYCDFPPVLTFWEALLYKFLPRKARQYRFPEFYNTIKKSLLVGAADKTQKNALLADVLIKPDILEYPNFIRTQNAEKLIEIGYEEAAQKFTQLKAIKL